MASTQVDGLSVLVVEDDHDAAMRGALQLILENHRLAIAWDGPTALCKIQEHPPNVVLLDLDIPGLDGYQVAAELHQLQRRNRPLLIAVGGYNNAGASRRCRAAGIDMHLVKPVDPEALCTLLRCFSRVLY